jgi:hypothetical protein
MNAGSYRARLRCWELGVALVALAALVFPLASVARAQGRPGPTRISGRTPLPVLSGQAHLVEHIPPTQQIRLTLTLQPQHADELQQFVNEVQRPGSPLFHHFLSFDQWKARYAPSAAQVQSVLSWASAQGLTPVYRFSSNLAVVVDGSVGAVERAFHLNLNSYELNGRHFYANDRDPLIGAAVAGVIKDVVGLDSLEQMHPASGQATTVDIPLPQVRPGPFIAQHSAHANASPSAPRVSAGPTPALCCAESGAGLEPPDLWSSQAYNYAALQGLGHCCNPTHAPGGTPPEQSIAIIGLNAPKQSDLDTFFQTYNLAENVTQVGIDGPSCCDDEMTIDAEWAGAMSNSRGSYLDTAHIYIYEGEGTLIEDDLEAWQKALSDNNARVASTSFGAYEDAYGGIFQKSISDFTAVTNAMAAIGWSIAASSGDHGAYDDCQNLSVEYPASDPNIVAVGGTTLTMNVAGGNVTFGQEVSWTGNGCGGTSYPGSNNGGGGGGCSNTFLTPWWQSTAITGCVDSDGTRRRGLPDISLNAGPANGAFPSPSGQAFYYTGQGGTWVSAGGTSIAAPEVAGFFAQVDAYLGYIGSTGDLCGASHDTPCAPMGNPAPAMWFGAPNAMAPHDPYYDVTSGCNGGSAGVGFCTTVGWDKATGWGSANMLQLAWAIMNFDDDFGVGRPTVSFGGPALNTWYNTDRTVSFNVSGTTGIAGYTAQWDSDPGDPYSHAAPGSGDPFWDGPKAVNGTIGSFSLAAAGLGCHTAYVRAWNNLGTGGLGTYGPLCFDNVPPQITCATADGQWHATDVSIPCTAVDPLSGLANPADASFNLSTSVPSGTETASALTGSRLVCDVAGNCAIAGPIGGNMVDKKPPVITITTPTATSYPHSTTITLNYGATDGGSGVQSVTATLDGSPTLAGHGLQSGQSINLLTELSLGQHTFVVQAVDNVGNTSSQSVTFSVVVTPDSIEGDVRQFLASGAITSKDIANALLSELEAAKAARQRKQCGTAANDYQAFINDVLAQTGITINSTASKIMVADARYLIAHCP